MTPARRRWMSVTAALAGSAAASKLVAQTPAFPGEPHRHPMADPAYRMQFPRDFGAHAAFRTEWWYVTGWLDGERGFQVTFFRARTAHPSTNPSRFAPTQLLFAQAALMLPAEAPSPACAARRPPRFTGHRLLGRRHEPRHGQLDLFPRSRRPLPRGDPGLRLHPRPDAGAAGSAGAGDQSALAAGELGFSRKGPQPTQASHYYSRPQLRVGGKVDGKPVEGIAWFDHEWSTTVLDPAAAGWDWTGINLDDGSALVAFRIRRRPASTGGGGGDGVGDVQAASEEPLWHYCALRHPDGSTEQVDSIAFEVLQRWRSPRTQAIYPIAMKLVLPRRTLRLEPLFEDQEIDGRQSTGTIYWEGAVRVLSEAGIKVGLGYLELTGYHTALRL